MFGCLSPLSDRPSSISCARDSFSELELLSVKRTKYTVKIIVNTSNNHRLGSAGEGYA